LHDAWNSNKDGAGFMFRADNKIRIRKGFMQLHALVEALKAEGFVEDNVLTKEREIALHFRIATSGGVCAERTHPFPITKYYNIQERTAHDVDSAIMHNGVIGSLGGPDWSDTQEFVSTVVHPVFQDGMSAKQLQEDINSLLDVSLYSSKFLVFTNQWTYWLGDFKEEDGVKYSNLNHRSTVVKSQYISLPSTDDGFAADCSRGNNAIINTLRRLGATTLLPYVKLVEHCHEAGNCLECPFFRFKKGQAICKPWRKHKSSAVQHRPDLIHFLLEMSRHLN